MLSFSIDVYSGSRVRVTAAGLVQDLAIGATSTFFLVSVASKTSFTNKKVENCSSFGASDS